jgi:hypothetical protein
MQIWESSIDATPNRDIQKICTNSQVKSLSSWILFGREMQSSISEKSLVWIQLRLQIRHTRISVSFLRIPGIINASNGRQRIDIRGQTQDSYKYAELWRQLWTYITSGFRLSKVLGADVCCTKIDDSGSNVLITAVNISRINEYWKSNFKWK